MVDRWVKKSEWAELVVNGAVFSDWKSVWAQCTLGKVPAYQFKFTATEGTPFAANFGVLRIRPGDMFQLYLAGQLVMTGPVTTRTVHYDAKQHSVEITGTSSSHILAVSGAITKTGQFHDQDWQGMAKKLIGPHGIGLQLLGSDIGKAMQNKFPRAAVHPGETVNAFLERYARPLGIQMSSNEKGDLVAIAGKMAGVAAVVEGENILIGRETIVLMEKDQGKDVSAGGGRPGTNKDHGPAINQVLSKVTEAGAQFGSMFQPSHIMSEIPAWTKKMMEGRSNSETKWNEQEKITVTVTVYGWEYTPGALWYRGQEVFVNSPMLMMKQGLTARVVTFTQDNESGTRTTLELVGENLLGQLAISLERKKDRSIEEDEMLQRLKERSDPTYHYRNR